MITKVCLFLGLTLHVVSAGRSAISEQEVELFSGHHGDLSHIGQHEPEHHETYAWAYPSYEFSYHVDDPHTHDMKGHHEVRDGDKVTGNYWLIQPDGRKRTVKYTSDYKNGFHAEVHYQPSEGHHQDVRDHHRNDHGHGDHQTSNWEYGKRVDGGHQYNRWDRDHDRRIRVGIDDRIGGDHDDRHHDDEHLNNDNKNRRDHSGIRFHDDHNKDYNHDDRRHHGIRRDHDNKNRDHRNHDNNRQHHNDRHHDGHLWAWIRARKEHNDHNDKKNVPRNHGNEEHWKHGVLVGWSEGEDRNRKSHSEVRGHHNINDSYGSRRNQHSYLAPSSNFKPLIPYGDRLY